MTQLSTWQFSERDVEMALKARPAPATGFITTHRHGDAILGEPRTSLLARGLVVVRPVLDNGRPTAWMIEPTAFGEAVKSAANAKDRV